MTHMLASIDADAVLSAAAEFDLRSETRPDRPMVDCPRGPEVRSARDRTDGRDVRPAINYRLKPHWSAVPLHSYRADAIEGSERLRAISSRPGAKKVGRKTF
jgi:hypothetical protein